MQQSFTNLRAEVKLITQNEILEKFHAIGYDCALVTLDVRSVKFEQ